MADNPVVINEQPGWVEPLLALMPDDKVEATEEGTGNANKQARVLDARTRYLKEEVNTLTTKVNAVSNDRLPFNRNIVVYGDSRAYQCVKGNVGLAFWTSAKTEGAVAFPDAMNAGVDGNTTSQQAQRLPQLLASLDKFDVIIHLGSGNDRLRNQTFNETINNLSEIYATLLANGKTVIVIAETPVEQAAIGLSDEQLAIHYQVHLWMLSELPKRGVIVVNPWDDMVEPGNVNKPLAGMLGDGVHPSPKGAEIIGNHVATAVSKLFKNTITLPTSYIPFSTTPPETAHFFGSINPNPLLIGNDGSAGDSGGATITTVEIASNTGIGGNRLIGLTVAITKETNPSGGEYQVMSFTGTPTGDQPTLGMEQDLPITNLTVGMKLVAQGRWAIQTDAEAVLQVGLELEVTYQNDQVQTVRSGQNTELNYPLRQGDLSGIFDTQILELASAPKTLKLRVVIVLKKGVAQTTTVRVGQLNTHLVFTP
ncbi:lipase [Pseudomonas phage EL]|uniref:Putative GDSL lipase family protein n=1 Tax=Pseudomonas phage EL TaxID=273133 RepID=Q2Z0S4_9CAUD|nr:lipase [Pseudomonas phage EL]CAG27251.1 putative GDSL lipase family protein [Pseudomonas phage EL]